MVLNRTPDFKKAVKQIRSKGNIPTPSEELLKKPLKNPDLWLGAALEVVLFLLLFIFKIFIHFRSQISMNNQRDCVQNKLHILIKTSTYLDWPQI